MLGRSGDVQLIPVYPNYISGGLTHSTPFDYTQDVPIWIYGPGYVKPGVYSKPTYLTDIAPTEGAILKYDFHAPDGIAQTQALLPASKRPLPNLLVTLVWDSGGWDVIDTWKKDLPYFESMLPKGALFTHATVGASPSNTPTGHAEIGTGAFPQHNGFVDEYININGHIEKPNANGPGFLLLPTLADVYDRAMGNKPVVAGVMTLSAHAMMMSHGSMWGGGDKDILVTREVENASTSGAEAPKWNVTPAMAPFYTFPGWVNSLPPIQNPNGSESIYTRQLDQADGKLDGKWRDQSIAALHGGFDTPARTPYETTLIEALIKRFHLGKHSVPDLLDINYKAIDTIGHLFSLNSLEMSDAVKYQDVALQQLMGFLNKYVGQGKWAMVLTADHGTQYSPDVKHAPNATFQIDITRFTQAVNKAFDKDGDKTPLVTKVRPTEMWLDPAEMARNHVSLNDVAQFVMDLTQADTNRVGKPLNPATASAKVFAAAFPSTMLSRLPCLPEAHG